MTTDELDNKDIRVYDFSTAASMGLSREDVAKIFKEHKFMTRTDMLKKYDFKQWISKKQKENALHRLYKHVIDNMEMYSDLITEQEAREVMEVVSGRMISVVANQHSQNGLSVRASVARPVDDLNKKVEGIVAKLSNILELKLDTVNSKSELKKLRLTDLTTALGTMIDKGRLMRGEATQHIAHIVDEKGVSNMSKDDILDALATQRTQNAEVK